MKSLNNRKQVQSDFLKRVERLCGEDVANQTGMTPATLHSELEKARELLRDANQLLWDGLRNGNELVPFPTRSKVDEITTFLNEGKK